MSVLGLNGRKIFEMDYLMRYDRTEQPDKNDKNKEPLPSEGAPYPKPKPTWNRKNLNSRIKNEAHFQMFQFL